LQVNIYEKAAIVILMKESIQGVKRLVGKVA